MGILFLAAKQAACCYSFCRYVVLDTLPVDILVLLGLDIRGLDTLVSDTRALDTPIIDILELVSIRNVRPMLNPKPRLSHFTDMGTSALDTLDLDIMDLDILHLATLDKSKFEHFEYSRQKSR